MSDLSDAEQLTKAIVEWLSHEVVLNKDDFGALQFFQNQWQIKSTRYCLAELQNSIQERLSWKHVEVLLVLMEEESKLDSKLLGLLQLHVLIDELLDIDSNDEDEHEKLGKRAQSFATKRAVQDATKFLQAHRSKETVSLLFKPPYKRDFLREKMSTWIRSYMLRLSRPEIPCVLKREQVKRRHHETRYTKDRVANLKEARARLTAEVEDPLPEARAVAKRARSGGGNLYEPKPSARRLDFTPEEENDDDEEIEDPPVQLSDVPKKMATNVTPQRRVKSPDGRSPGKRRAWTLDEKMAVKAGVEKFGAGKWMEIRSHYNNTLKNRTNMMIKDCYRTMVRKGEILE